MKLEEPYNDDVLDFLQGSSLRIAIVDSYIVVMALYSTRNGFNRRAVKD